MAIRQRAKPLSQECLREPDEDEVEANQILTPLAIDPVLIEQPEGTRPRTANHHHAAREGAHQRETVKILQESDGELLGE